MEHPEAALPIELEVDKYHPDNYGFMKQVRRVEDMMVVQSNLCRTQDVPLIKSHFMGKTTKEIAKLHRKSGEVVRSALKRPESLRLLRIMRHHAALWEGPTIEMRVRGLTEIWVDNQQDDPRVAISAIAEMNKMQGVGKEKFDPDINITINANMFPKGALDG
jgi:hypothetical protein